MIFASNLYRAGLDVEHINFMKIETFNICSLSLGSGNNILS